MGWDLYWNTKVGKYVQEFLYSLFTCFFNANNSPKLSFNITNERKQQNFCIFNEMIYTLYPFSLTGSFTAWFLFPFLAFLFLASFSDVEFWLPLTDAFFSATALFCKCIYKIKYCIIYYNNISCSRLTENIQSFQKYILALYMTSYHNI